MNRNTVKPYVNTYCRLRDVQYAAYTSYAKAHGLTTNELFVLDILWFAPDGCLQSDICQRMSATKQTISAIVKKFLKQGDDQRDCQKVFKTRLRLPYRIANRPPP